MGIGHLTITDYRQPFIDFTIPYKQNSVTFMIAKKFSTRDETFDIANTDYPLMSLMILSAFALSVLIGIVSKQLVVNPNSRYAPIWSLFQCFIQKGNDDEPSNIKQRLLFIIWLLAGFITTATVGGELVALLADLPTKPIENLKELAEATNIKIYTLSSPTRTILKVS